MVWAYGEGMVWQQHIACGTVDINFATGASSKTKLNLKEELHGILMVAGMGFLLPVGVILARHAKKVNPCGINAFWFTSHKYIQSIGLLCAIGGVVLAFLFQAETKTAHLSILHAKIGIAVMGAAILQPLNAFIRPGKKAKHRLLWEIVHKGMGYLVPLASMYVIYLGLIQLGVSTMLRLAYYCLAGFLVLIWIVLEVVRMARGNSESSVTTYEPIIND